MDFQVLLWITFYSFGFHLLWEFLQCIPFFVHGTVEGTWRGMIQATLGDVVLTWISFLAVAALCGQRRWVLDRPWTLRARTTLVATALLFGIGIESLALRTERWSYTEFAPLIPGTKISIIPVLQLLLLLPVTFALARRRRLAQNG